MRNRRSEKTRVDRHGCHIKHDALPFRSMGLTLAAATSTGAAMLSNLGFYTGAVDGISVRDGRAVKSYQKTFI
jgi:hypothetical protein